MLTVTATELKNRLGPVLTRAELEPVAIVRHGRVVAHLVPVRPPQPQKKRRSPAQHPPRGLDRSTEERLVALCASGDLRPSRWLRAGPPEMLAGIAVMLASQHGYDRFRLLALAERLAPGMSTVERFGSWLAHSPISAAHFFAMLDAARRQLSFQSSGR